jgi:hypothetical protein
LTGCIFRRREVLREIIGEVLGDEGGFGKDQGLALARDLDGDKRRLA